MVSWFRKKSEPTVSSSRAFASPQQQTSKHGTGGQYLSSSHTSGRYSATDGNGRTNRTANITPKGNASGNSETTPYASSTPGSPRRLTAKHRGKLYSFLTDYSWTSSVRVFFPFLHFISLHSPASTVLNQTLFTVLFHFGNDWIDKKLASTGRSRILCGRRG